jgi:hypothetical protein
MVHLWFGRSQQRRYRASAASQPKCKTEEAEALQNGRRKSGSSEGLGAAVTRCRFHERGEIARVAGKRLYGEEKMESGECV